MREEDWEGAGVLFQRILEIEPDLELALAGSGRCLGRLGLRTEAVDKLSRAAAAFSRGLARPGRVDALLDLVYELHLNRAFWASLPFLDKAIKARPALARAHHMKAQALERLGMVEEARREAARAHALAPHEANAAILLATLESRGGNQEDARSRLEAVVSHAEGSEKQRALLELGRVLDRQGEWDGAFMTLAQAGRLELAAPEMARFDSEGIHRELAEDRERCTPEWLHAHARAGAGEMHPPLFLVGFYRSGTTLLERLLAAHPAIRSSDEADLVPHMLRALYRAQPDPALHWTARFAALDEDASAHLRTVYRKRARDCLGEPMDGSILLDKTAMNLVNLGVIRAVYPDARLVFALRDPRDVLLSCFMQAFSPNPLTAQLLDWRSGARLYDAVMAHWQAMAPLFSDRVTVVRYERLAADPRAELAPLLDHFGLAWHEDMERFHELAANAAVTTPSYADVARPVHTGAVGRWRNYARHFESVRDLLERHVDGFGYGPWT